AAAGRCTSSTTAIRSRNCCKRSVSPRPRFGGEGSGVRGRRSKPLTPDPSPQSTGARGEMPPSRRSGEFPPMTLIRHHPLLVALAVAVLTAGARAADKKEAAAGELPPPPPPDRGEGSGGRGRRSRPPPPAPSPQSTGARGEMPPSRRSGEFPPMTLIRHHPLLVALAVAVLTAGARAADKKEAAAGELPPPPP